MDTFGTVMLGLSVACAKCHSHKYDPITQRDFYALYAFFNNVPEQGLDGTKGNAAPYIKAPTREQQQRLDQLAGEIAELERSVDRRAEELVRGQAEWERGVVAGEGSEVRTPDDMAVYLAFDEESGDKTRDCTKSKYRSGTTRVAPSELVTAGGVCSGDSGSGAIEQKSFTAGAPLVIGVASRGELRALLAQ